jgi:trehalose 6-phosphate synthase
VSPGPGRPILVASNRGPVTFSRSEDGSLAPRRGAGGLVTALTSALQVTGGRWVASAMSEGDRERAAESGGRFEVDAGGARYDLRLLDPGADVFDAYYNRISNRILWFCHHYLWDVPRYPRFGADTAAAWDGYRAVNALFAEALAEEAESLGTAPAILVQDYHLCLVPALVRGRGAAGPIAHFSHSPFAGPDYLRVLPDEIRTGILEGMLGADLVGFQAAAWADNFLAACGSLPGAEPDRERRTVRWQGRNVRVGVFPISIDADALRRETAAPEVAARREALATSLGEMRLILRADRMELSKNVIRGFLAYERLLLDTPEWRGRVRFLAHLYPSRADIPEYRAYAQDCEREAERINAALREPEWEPITLSVKDDFQEALSAYGRYDVLLVNPVFDGMNLVAKEGPVVNDRDGVLVLSRNAGAHDELAAHALVVNPFDVGETAEALHSALSMPADERARRAKGLREVATANPPVEWVRRQLEDLEEAIAR